MPKLKTKSSLKKDFLEQELAKLNLNLLEKDTE